jgi:hypothetical protein
MSGIYDPAKVPAPAYYGGDASKYTSMASIRHTNVTSPVQRSNNSSVTIIYQRYTTSIRATNPSAPTLFSSYGLAPLLFNRERGEALAEWTL